MSYTAVGTVKKWFNSGLDYVNPTKGDDVWHFRTLSWMGRAGSHAVAEAMRQFEYQAWAEAIDNHATALGKVTRFFDFTAPIKGVRNLAKGQYLDAAKSLDALSRIANRMADSALFKDVVVIPLTKALPILEGVAKTQVKRVITIVGQVGAVASAISDYNSMMSNLNESGYKLPTLADMPSADDAKKILNGTCELAKRSFVNITSIRSLEDGINLVDSAVHTTMVEFEKRAPQVKKIADTTALVGWFALSFAFAIPALDISYRTLLASFAALSLADVVSHVADEHIKKDEIKALFRLIRGSGYSEKEIKNALSYLEDGFKMDFVAACQEKDAKLFSTQAHLFGRLFNEHVQTSFKSTLPTNSLDDQIRLSKTVRMRSFETSVSRLFNVMTKEWVGESGTNEHEATVEQLIELATVQGLDWLGKLDQIDLRQKTAYENFDGFLTSTSKLRDLSKLAMLPLRVLEEGFDCGNMGKVANAINAEITPLILFSAPLKWVKKLQEFNWEVQKKVHVARLAKEDGTYSASHGWLRHNVVVAAELGQSVFLNGVKIARWSLEASGIEMQGWYSVASLNKLQSVQTIFAAVMTVNGIYEFGVTVYNEFSWNEKSSNWENIKSNIEVVATWKNAQTALGLTGDVALVVLGGAMFFKDEDTKIPYVKTMFLAAQAVRIIPRLYDTVTAEEYVDLDVT